MSSFLTAYQHTLGYSVPENGVKNAIKERKYNQGYLVRQNAKTSNVVKVKVKMSFIK